MILTIKAVAKDPKQAQGKTYWPVLHTDQNWYNLITNDRPQQGQNFDVDVKLSEFNGKTYRWANIIPQSQRALAQAQSPAPQNGGLNQYLMAEALAFWWEKVAALELVDEAKASVLCTLLIATSDGRVKFEEPELPEAEDNIPF